MCSGERQAKRETDSETDSLPVSKWEILVAKSGQDGRKDTNSLRPWGLEVCPKMETKLIVFMLGNTLQAYFEEMQDVC